MSLAITIIKFTPHVQGTQPHEENQIQIENYNNMIRSVTAGWLCYGHTKEEETKDGGVFTEQVTFRMILQTSVEIQRAPKWNWNALYLPLVGHRWQHVTLLPIDKAFDEICVMVVWESRHLTKRLYWSDQAGFSLLPAQPTAENSQPIFCRGAECLPWSSSYFCLF